MTKEQIIFIFRDIAAEYTDAEALFTICTKSGKKYETDLQRYQIITENTMKIYNDLEGVCYISISEIEAVLA